MNKENSISVGAVEALRDLAMVNIHPVANTKKRFDALKRHAFAISEREELYNLKIDSVDNILAVTLGRAGISGYSMVISFFEEQIAANKRHFLSRDMYRFAWRSDSVKKADLVTHTQKFSLKDILVLDNSTLMEITHPHKNTVSRALEAQDCVIVANRMLAFAHGLEKKVA